MITLLAGSAVAGGAVPVLPPGVTLPPGAADPTTTTVAPTTTAPLPTVPPSTTPPAPATPPTTAAETRLIPVPPPQAPTRIVPGPAGPAGPPPPTVTTTTRPGAATSADAPSLTDGQVGQMLRSMERSGASSTAALVEALKPLQAFGMTAQEALALGMGRFPLQGPANWTDDWLDPRSGPPPHQHKGNDLFAAFDTPVRAPVDGIVRFANEGLGGSAAYVTAPDGTYYYMAHLKGFNPDLASGAAVKQGQIVAFNGDSGNARGGAPHVHFEIHPGGGAAVNPKPIVDAWVAEALARVPELIASFQPAAPAGGPDDGGVPQILVATGLTRRFSLPSRSSPASGPDDFNRAVLGPLTPPVLGPLLDMAPAAP